MEIKKNFVGGVICLPYIFCSSLWGQLVDGDFDRLTDGDEVAVHGTDPKAWDTDGDGMPDGWEVTMGLDPLIADGVVDTDGDQIINLREFEIQSDPKDAGSPSQILFVDDDAAEGGDGSLGKPFRSIREALPRFPWEVSGDRWIRVYPGTYRETELSVNSQGEESIALTSEEGARNTVVELGVGFRVLEANNATIMGFTFQGGQGEVRLGGRLILANNVFTGIDARNSGIDVSVGEQTFIVNNVFRRIQAESAGIALGIRHENWLPLSDAAYTMAVVTNNTIVGNATSTSEFSAISGIRLWPRGSGKQYTLIENNIVAQNDIGMTFFRVDHPQEVVVDHNNVWNNPRGNYVFNQGEQVQPGDGEISADPLLVDLPGGNWHLQGSSPCIDRGAPRSPHLISGDIDGELRVSSRRGVTERLIDLGADEFPLETIPVVRAVLAPASAIPGRIFVVTWESVNEGNVYSVPSWYDVVILSRDDRFDPSDIVLGRVFNVGPLAPSASLPVKLELPLPAIAEGNYRVLIAPMQGRLELGGTVLVSWDFPEVVPGGPVVEEVFAGLERSRYFRMPVDEGEKVKIFMEPLEDVGLQELFCNHGTLPTRVLFGIRNDKGPILAPSLTVPETAAGT